MLLDDEVYQDDNEGFEEAPIEPQQEEAPVQPDPVAQAEERARQAEERARQMEDEARKTYMNPDYIRFIASQGQQVHQQQPPQPQGPQFPTDEEIEQMTDAQKFKLMVDMAARVSQQNSQAAIQPIQQRMFAQEYEERRRAVEGQIDGARKKYADFTSREPEMVKVAERIKNFGPTAEDLYILQKAYSNAQAVGGKKRPVAMPNTQPRNEAGIGKSRKNMSLADIIKETAKEKGII